MINFRVSRSQPGSVSVRSGGSFTPPLPRAISNTLMKIGNRDNMRSPPVGLILESQSK